MIFIIIILIIVIAFCIPSNNDIEIQNNEIEQVNIIQEKIEDDNTEYIYVPVTNGKTVQMIRIPKVEK